MNNNSEYCFVVGLEETYTDVGLYEFKIFLNKDRFKNAKFIDIKMFCPDRNLMDFEYEYWGRKIVCSFAVEEHTKNGVCVVRVDYKKKYLKSFSCWVIK